MLSVILKTIVMFTVVLVMMRIMGKRQLGEMELSELVVALMISELGTSPICEEDRPLLLNIAALSVLLIYEYLLSWLSMKSLRFRAIISGKPSILIKDGHIIQSEMRRNRFTIDELNEALRGQSMTDISLIKYAILETDGELNVIPYASEQPLTNRNMGIAPEEHGLPVVIINDGRIVSENLKLHGYNEKWLKSRLSERGVFSHKEIFIMTVDDAGNIYFEKREQRQ